MLLTLPVLHKSFWPDMVSTITHAYNCTRSSATGYSPSFLMFGRQPLLAIYVLFNLKTEVTDLYLLSSMYRI